MRPLDLAIRATRPLFRRVMRGRGTIFLLHRVADKTAGISGHSLDYVRSALKTLKASGARFVSVRQIVEASSRGTGPGHDWVAFTIDDGFADQADLARAFLSLNCPVTIFLVSGFLDNQLWPWDNRVSYILKRTTAPILEITIAEKAMTLPLQTAQQRASSLERLRNHCKAIPNTHLYALVDDIARQAGVTVPQQPPSGYASMSWGAARALEEQGVEFAPHSVTHRIFSQLEAEEAEAEIAVSWRRLQEELRRPLPVFAWPTGRAADYGNRDIALVGKAGFLAHVTAEDDYVQLASSNPPGAPLALKRFSFPKQIVDVLQYGSALERIKQIARTRVAF